MGVSTLPAIDMDTAKAMTDSLALCSGVCCRLFSAQGEVLYRQGNAGDECTFLKGIPGEPPRCENLHLYGMSQAKRFGGRYIYACPSGLTYCASPILIGGLLAGGLVAGPVLLMETEDLLDDLSAKRGLPGRERRALGEFLQAIPRWEPARMSQLAIQLFASAICVGDSTWELLRAQDSHRQQRAIGEYVHKAKSETWEAGYPMEKEEALFHAVAQGNRVMAAELLNELLGYIFFFISDPEAIRTRVTELLLVLSRGCASGGGSVEAVLDISHRYLQELRLLRTQEDITRWLAKVLGRYTVLVFDMVDSKHANSIRKALGYLQMNYDRELTLAELAEYVNYSPSHFSKIFKEETGCSFRSYLNRTRVEKSKALLMDDQLSIAEVCTACGFGDQSYYGRVFKRIVGVTPDKYRRQGRRIDDNQEHAALDENATTRR